MTAEKLAVVISTYNAPHFLRLVLDGYRQQTDHNFSIYIADDGSGSETAELIRSISEDLPVPIHHVWQEDCGFRKARIHNETIRRIKEPWVLLTDGDCIPLPSVVAAHRRMAGDDYFISGSRILLSADFTSLICKEKGFITHRSISWWISQRFKGNINRMLPLLLPARLSPASTQLAGIRGCHLSCARSALEKINGFDESFEGWGREDSDLTARLLHAGLKRRNLRGAPVLHLWHQEFSRDRLHANDETLQACLRERRIEALQGLNELENRDG